MKTNGLWRYLLFLVLILVPAFASAQWAEDALRFSQYGLNPGARALGMGGVGVGLADDLTGLFTNPAGLAQVRSYELSVGLNRDSYNNDLSYFGTTTRGNTSSTSLSHVGFVYPLPTSRGSLTFAFGYGRSADYTTIQSAVGMNPSSSVTESLIPTSVSGFLFDAALIDTGAHWGTFNPLVKGGVRQAITVLEGGGLNAWSVGMGMDIAKELSIGVTLNFMSGSYSYDRQFSETDPNNLYTHYVKDTTTDMSEFRWDSNIKSDLTGFNALIGIMYRKQGKFRIGATVRTPTHLEVSESFADSYRAYAHYLAPYPADGPYILTGDTKYRIITPTVFSLGASVQPTEWLMVAGDAEYTDWTEVQFDTDNPDLISENQLIKTSYLRDTWNLRGGAEVTIWDLGLKLRGGVVYNPSPWKADAPFKERDQLYYTAGLGIQVEGNVAINLAYAYGSWKTFHYNYSISGLPEASRNDESIGQHNMMVSLSYRF
jgi:long-subunit fatty acid transport protein